MLVTALSIDQQSYFVFKICFVNNAFCICILKHFYGKYFACKYFLKWSQTSPSPPVGAPCGLRGCKNGPAPFPGRMSYKATKPGLVFVLYLSMFIIVLLFIRAPFYVLIVFIVCVVCLLVVLVKLSLLAKLLARKTPLSSESSPLQFLALA